MAYNVAMAFIRKVKTSSGATAVQIIHKVHGKIVRINHIGSAHNKEELQILLGLARQQLIGSQQSLFASSQAELKLKIGLKQSFSGLLLKILTEQYNGLGFNQLADGDFASLCLARIVEPTSKLDSLRVLADLGVLGLNKDRLYRCLIRTVDQNYRKTIADLCFSHANSRGLNLVLYDITTLYFEAQQEDDYRKPGMSKERRLEPQIIVGLLVDQHGFPLGLHSFEGSIAETKTILPVMEQFKSQHDLNDITVVTDAAMLSASNLQALTEAGYHYIVGSRIHKIPYNIVEYQKTGKLSDNQIVVTSLENSRIIYQYREKRAALDIRNIQKQIAKAEKIILGKTPVKKAKFLAVKTKEKKLNQTLIDKAYAMAGIKGYVTNLDIPDDQVIACYHQLFNVEASFRMAKSDLKARPIFHRKRDSIEAHLTIVLAALAVARTIEKQTELSIRKFINTLRPIRSGTIIINGQEYFAEAEIPSATRLLLQKLKTGH